MTATSETTHSRPVPASLSASDLEARWRKTRIINDGVQLRELPLINFAGRNFPTLDDQLMTDLLDIQPNERVVDIGVGITAFSRADEVVSVLSDCSLLNCKLDGKEDRRAGDHAGNGKSTVERRMEALPFSDKEFDVAYSRGTLERISDPAAACREMMRIAKRGFIETSSTLTEYVGGNPANRWITWIERLPGCEPVLVFRRKPFRRAPFRHASRGIWFTDADFRFRWEWQYRNVTFNQFAWVGSFAFRVEEDPDGFNYDDPIQAAEAHVDSAINAMRFGGGPIENVVADAARAVNLCPDWAVAQNVLGCALWGAGRFEEGLNAFDRARKLDPRRVEYAHNARLRPGMQNAMPSLVLLPPIKEDCEDVETNFAGKVHYAFVGYDARLARDIGVKPGDRVLDVGGGQRPLERADLSVDFDVFEGVHRQGLTINRSKPLVCGDVQRLPFKTHSFDVACCRMVLEHVVDPEAACRELQRVAKRGFIETPNTLWECLYGHPTHRWIIEWEAQTRTLVFRRKPFDSIPFKSAIVPFLYTQPDVQRAFEVTFRNIASTQITWDEAHPFSVRVEGDEEAAYDYLGRPEDAAKGSLNYSTDLLNWGLPQVALAEADDALRHAVTPELRRQSLGLRLRIAEQMRDTNKARELRSLLSQEAAIGAVVVTSGPLQARTATTALPPVVWSAPLRDPSGYADEARHFLFALDGAGVALSAREIRWNNRIALLPPERERTLHRLMRRPTSFNPVHVCHILAPLFRRDPSARVNIGRTMFETDRLPEGWASACNMMDFVWVPGEFNRRTFAAAGVKPEKLRVVPGAIDLTPYHPGCTPLAIQGRRGYNFLSVFDWTLRKGWDILIQAFVEEFRPDEDVALIFKTHSSLGYTIDQIAASVGEFLTGLGHDLNRIPDIIFQDTTISDADMPRLYGAADCYVMPSHGEGWGRPYMEAMAMGLPVIGTGWSGQTAFMNADNSLLLDSTLAPVPEAGWRETATFKGHQWAEPSLAHLKQLMRRAFDDREGGRELGQRARAHLESHFSYPVVARIITEELARLA